MNVEIRSGVIRPVEVYKEAWSMIKSQFWMVFAVTFVGMMMAGIIPIIIAGPMIAGIFIVMFAVVDGGRADFGLLFKGFDHFLQSLFVVLIVAVPIFFFVIAMYVPMVLLTISGQRLTEAELWKWIIGVFAVELVFGVIMTIVHSFLMFALPLVVDKRVSAIQACKLSIIGVWRNMSGIAGLMGLGIAACIVGYLMLCLGIYLVIPLIVAATAVACRKIFPRADAQFFTPPSPDRYSQL